MYYHASQTANIKVLEPRVSNHGTPLVYMSTKRENVLVYLSNAIEKYCKETGFCHQGRWQKWGPYGFESDGTFRLEEYYPNALVETYKGVSGYIYFAEKMNDPQENIQISNAVTSSEPVAIDGCEFVPDVYEAIMEAAEKGQIKILRYEDLSDKKLDWIKKTMKEEYKGAVLCPEYQYFLKAKFPFCTDEK